MKLTVCAALLTAVTICRADLVILRNSDRLSGKVQKLEQSALTLKTSYAGTLKIDWKVIQNVVTDRPFEVEVENGLRLLGTLQESEQGLLVMTEEKEVAVSPLRVVRMEPATAAPEGFWDRVSGAIDLGYSLAKGNSDLTQSSLNINTQYRSEKNEVQANLSSLFSRQLDAPTNSRHAVSLRYDRLLSPAAFTFAITGLERDERRRLSLRSNMGGGFGWKLIRSARTNFSILGGITFVNEQFNRADGTQPRNSSGEGLAAMELEKTTWQNVRLFTKLSAHPNFVERGRYRLVFDGGVRMPLVGRLTWSLNLFDRFDSRPPLAVERNDYGLISSFGVTF